MSYATDLTDKQWDKIKIFFDTGKYGNRAKHDKRTLVNAVFYITRTGCQWRMLPNDFPPHFTVHSFYRRAKKKGIWEKILQALVKESRIKSGRNSDPTYSIIDSQSVKTVGRSAQIGIDGGKKN